MLRAFTDSPFYVIISFVLSFFVKFFCEIVTTQFNDLICGIPINLFIYIEMCTNRYKPTRALHKQEGCQLVIGIGENPPLSSPPYNYRQPHIDNCNESIQKIHNTGWSLMFHCEHEVPIDLLSDEMRENGTTAWRWKEIPSLVKYHKKTQMV